ncbi:hypothetical protein GCM10027416_16650 [Okibacterium endophyticum]
MHVSTRLRGGALLGVLALAGGLALPTAAHAADAPVVNEDPIRLDTGHIDAFNLVLNEDDTARLVLKEDVTGSRVLHTPESVELGVKSQAVVKNLPSGGLPSGAPSEMYFLPLTQDPELIWPGWDSQSVGSVYGSDANVDVDVTTVEGPGEVYLWTNGTWGAPAPLLKDGAWKLPGTIQQSFLAHVHANWGFTEPGTYTLTAQATVTSEDGSKTSTTNEATYTFVVAPAPTSVTISGAENVVQPDSEVTLTAAQTPADSTFSAYSWSTRASASAEWETVEGATGPTLDVTAVDGAEYRATVSGGKDYSSDPVVPVTVESAPVTISVAQAPEQTIAIEPLAGHYHSNSPIDLSVIADPVVENATYRWYLQRTDQDAPVQIDGATGATHRLIAEQALNGAKVIAELVSDAGAVLAEAAPVTVEVDDHGAAPLQKVTIGGLDDHYHTGDSVDLTAVVAPASVLDRFEWYVQKAGEATPVLVESENSAAYSFTASEELAGAAVIAKLTYDDGRSYAESAPVIVRLDDHTEVPDTELTVTTDRDADDYWVGQTATLTAEQSTPTGLADYQWQVKLPGAAGFAAVDGQTAAEYKFKPSLANSGVQVKVQLLHDGKVHAESAPVTITAQQRPVVTTLIVTADKESYAPGDTAQFTSRQDPETGKTHYHWYIKRVGASDFVWVDQSRDKDLALPVTADDDGAQLVLRLFDDTHAVIAESQPHTLNVTSNGIDPEPSTELSIDGVSGGYHVGETAALTAVQTPETGEDHYHWFIKRTGDADYSVISGASTGTLEQVITEGDAGAQVVVKLYNHDHEVIAESAAATLNVLPGAAKPDQAPQTPNGSALDGVTEGGITVSTTTPAPGQVITVQIGEGADQAGEWVAAWLFSEPVLLGADWLQVGADGTIAVTIPSDTTLGAHRLAVFDDAGDVIGWQQLQVTAVADTSTPGATGTPGGLALTGSEFAGASAAAAVLLLLGAGTLRTVRRRRSANVID